MSLISTGMTLDRWHRLLPEVESVTFGSRAAANVAGAPSFASYTLDAKKYAPSQSPFNAGAELPSRTRKWQLVRAANEAATAIAPASLPVPDPKESDRITDSGGVRWYVRSVEVLLFGTVFNCTCEREVG